MSDSPTDDLQFDEDAYARPNQRWICGWAADGRACPLGPAQRGSCRSAFECAPYRQGDTWKCSRSRSHGGPCDEGPLPEGACCRPIARCQPARSVLAQRGIVSYCVFALAVGVALIMVDSPARTGFVSPGPLNPQHSTVVQSCADCHAGGESRLGDWIPAAFDSHPAGEQSSLCLKCHRNLGNRALAPHGLATADLAAITKRLQTGRSPGSDPVVLAAKTAFDSPAGKHGTLACATCHREHHGKDFELVNTTNRQCQICHAASFHSFSSGHAQFSDYPYERRTRLYFDHLSHYGSHFGEARRSCSECHAPDVSGRYMLLRGFKQTCEGCHGEQIEEDFEAGIAFANIPGLDVESLKNNSESGIDVGQWPALYPLHVEAAGRTPLMQLLLSSSEGIEEIWQQLDGVDLCDLSAATPEQLAQVANFIWAFKEMFYDVVQGGQPVVRQRLTAALAPQVSDTDIAELVKQVPIELLAEMQRRWLPNLIAEVEARRAGSQLPVQDGLSNRDPLQTLNEEKRSANAVTSGWYLRDSDLSLRYRPAGHADPLLKELIGVSAPFAISHSSTDRPAQAFQQMFASLSAPFATGRCLKCHTVDSAATGTVTINWFAYQPSLTQRRFTEFKHSPHVTLLDDEACITCHELRTDDSTSRSIFRPEFVNPDWTPVTDPHRFTSSFTAMTISNCSQCHTQSAAGDRCLTCHNYHIHDR